MSDENRVPTSAHSEGGTEFELIRSSVPSVGRSRNDVKVRLAGARCAQVSARYASLMSPRVFIGLEVRVSSDSPVTPDGLRPTAALRQSAPRLETDQKKAQNLGRKQQDSAEDPKWKV